MTTAPPPAGIPRLDRETAPVKEAQRIAPLDVLRGFALLGILVMNIQMFSMIDAAYDNPTAYGDLRGANWGVWLAGHLLTDQKMYGLFSMLFGAGILLMTSRAEARGGSLGLHYRRMAWLILFGLLHAHLLWAGDILYRVDRRADAPVRVSRLRAGKGRSARGRAHRVQQLRPANAHLHDALLRPRLRSFRQREPSRPDLDLRGDLGVPARRVSPLAAPFRLRTARVALALADVRAENADADRRNVRLAPARIRVYFRSMALSMQAAVLVEARRLELREIPVPRLEPHQIMLRSTGVGICGTDLHIFGGYANYNYDALGNPIPLAVEPQILGHELSGVVEEVGREVRDLKVGDRILVDQGLSCRSQRIEPPCEYCASGDSH